MTNHSRALIPLCECLRGVLPKNPDWMSILGLANQTLTTTSLMPFVEKFSDSIPADVDRYVRELFERNLMRNEMLAAQLEEAIGALNQIGVTPILLKGAASLATSSRDNSATKLMSDLDILVMPDEVSSTIEALSSIGYELHAEALSSAQKWYTDWKRARDVGMIDLHGGLPGPAFFYSSAGQPHQYCRLSQTGHGLAYIPSPAYHAFIVTVHDQFQDYDYWLGSIDLRHLLDFRDFVQSSEGFDWDLLQSFPPDRLAKNALETQLVMLSSLLGVTVPESLRARWIPRLQNRRRIIQAKFPMLRMAFLPLAALDYRSYKTGVAAHQRTSHCDIKPTYTPNTGKANPFKACLRIFDLSRHKHSGKV